MSFAFLGGIKKEKRYFLSGKMMTGDCYKNTFLCQK